MEIAILEEEVNNLISRRVTLKEVGMLRVAQITIRLEELEIEMKKKLDASLEQYIDMFNRYPSSEGGILDLTRETAKHHANAFNKMKILNRKWNDWMGDVLDYF